MPTFQEVLDAENASLKAADAAKPGPGSVFGVAFSGGGIRSATFNLGFLQGLAQARMLPKISYLSTVSGGGYIGGWLISWIKRAGEDGGSGVSKVQDQLGNYQCVRQPGEPAAEPKQVSFLRDYSNYLTPRLGIFGADTLTAIAAYLRNVLLNQIILIAFLGSIIVVPWCILRSSRWISQAFPGILRDGFQGSTIAGVIAVVLLFLSICWASIQAARCSLTANPAPASAGPGYVFGLSVVPLFLSAMATWMSLWLAPANDERWRMWYWPGIGASAYGLVHVAGVACRILMIRSAKQPGIKFSVTQATYIPVTAFIAGAIGGFLLVPLDQIVRTWRSWGHGFAHGLTWGPALFVAAFLLTGTLHIGFMKLLIKPEEQEWWSRAGGFLLLLTAGWTALFALSIFVPWVLMVWAGWIKTKLALVASWALSTAFGVIAGKSPKTSGKKDRGPSGIDLVAQACPYIFIVGMLVLLSWGTFWLAERKLDARIRPARAAATVPAQNMSIAAEVRPESAAPGVGSIGATRNPAEMTISGSLTVKPAPSVGQTTRAKRKFWGLVSRFPVRWMWLDCGLLLLGSILVAYRVDINVFSMNLLYRNRLVRCYLGATRLDTSRHPNPFTGFDPEDEFSLAAFVEERGYDGPYPIVCAALNVTHGERLAWQERKAQSFVFTPRFCGYEFSEMRNAAKAKQPGGYRETEQYAYPLNKEDPFHAEIGGVHLGTAISISGAAASPNMGYHTSPPLAFLMTVFNVRLGWWLANPRYKNDELALGAPEGGPPCSLLYLLKELFASTTDRSDYVYLSDGGHFENLGIYELVRRRCKYIVACDADADQGMHFGDLGNAIRKCRSDLGVEITIDPTPIRLPSADGFAQVHGVIGAIRYPACADDGLMVTGKLLYVKPTMSSTTPRDVLAYRDMHPEFPDQPTADQWFDESQFESYRRLGLHAFRSLAGIAGDGAWPMTIEALFDSVKVQTPR
jgi:hypothetical protein